MKTFKMMEEIVCYCTKCKLELNQRIVRVDAGRPKRVLCLTCNTEHSYRKSAPKKTSGGKTRSKRAPSLKSDQEAQWRARLGERNANPRAYDINQSYLLDDYIEHKIFGVGLVVGLIYPDKVNVFFQDGLKTMKCSAMPLT